MASISAVLVLDLQGRTIVSRDYHSLPQGSLSRARITFVRRVIDETDPVRVVPVFSEEGLHYAWIKRGQLFLLAVATQNTATSTAFSFLYRLADVFVAYDIFTPDKLASSGGVVHELLDEVADHGIPQVTDPAILRDFITAHDVGLLGAAKRFLAGGVEEQPKAAPAAITGAVSWRSQGIVYPRNEVFVDVVEKVSLVISSGSTVGAPNAVRHAEIEGRVDMKAYLSGMPEVKIGFNDKLVLPAQFGVEVASGADDGTASSSAPPAAAGQADETLSDVRFHPGAPRGPGGRALATAVGSRGLTVSFVPPNGDFTLLRYRRTPPAGSITPPISVSLTRMSPAHASSRLSFLAKVHAKFPTRCTAKTVVVRIPIPSDFDSTQLRVSAGSAGIVPLKAQLVWTIRNLRGGDEATLNAELGLPVIRAESTQQETILSPIRVEFRLPFFTMSGLRVQSLKVHERSGYESFSWIRYATTDGGEYSVRSQ
jgi:AP-1 complex subunit mu